MERLGVFIWKILHIFHELLFLNPQNSCYFINCNLKGFNRCIRVSKVPLHKITVILFHKNLWTESKFETTDSYFFFYFFYYILFIGFIFFDRSSNSWSPFQRTFLFRMMSLCYEDFSTTIFEPECRNAVDIFVSETFSFFMSNNGICSIYNRYK